MLNQETQGRNLEVEQVTQTHNKVETIESRDADGSVKAEDACGQVAELKWQIATVQEERDRLLDLIKTLQKTEYHQHTCDARLLESEKASRLAAETELIRLRA